MQDEEEETPYLATRQDLSEGLWEVRAQILRYSITQ